MHRCRIVVKKKMYIYHVYLKKRFLFIFWVNAGYFQNRRLWKALDMVNRWQNCYKIPDKQVERQGDLNGYLSNN